MTPARVLVALLATFPLSSGHLSSQTTPAIAGQSLRVNGFEIFTHRQAALDVFALLDELDILSTITARSE